MDLFLKYVCSKIEKRNLENLSSQYTAEGIKIITENTARFAGGSSLKMSLAEVKEEIKKPVDNRTSEQIETDIFNKLKQYGKVVKE